MSIVGNVLERISPRRRGGILNAVLEYLPELAYRRLKESGFQPAAIIDIGAYRGDWTKLIRRFFPATPVLMIEAQEKQRDALLAISSPLTTTATVICLLASESGKEVRFTLMETGSSIFSEKSDAPRHTRLMRTKTLDEVTSSIFRQSPLFLKLDVQGAEIEVLRGASETLKLAEVVQLETALTTYNEGAPQSEEVIAFMSEHGFSIWDIVSFVRPQPDYLSQIDLLFVRNDSLLRRGSFRFSQ